ncbi:MAG TPA: NUDIX hydrolase [Solirubrobacteraceae bacterium]|nr:NUDIX hydrolase [Solirubrobacteraceae bacterium]
MNGPALTVDVVVLAGDRPATVLLIKRGGDPFEGAWALPGGFVEGDERVAVAAARELREETGIEAGELELLGVYDTPGRDPRGPTVSVVFVMRAAEELDASGADDAADARWVDLGALPQLAFDHAVVVADALSFAARDRRS